MAKCVSALSSLSNLIYYTNLKMKKITKYICGAMLALGCAATASAQNMNVTMRDGKSYQFPTADVEKVYFDGVPTSQGPFEIKVSEVTSVSAKLEIFPEDKTQAYYFDVCTVSDYERFGGAKPIVDNFFVQVQGAYPELDVETILEAMCSWGNDSDVVKGLPSDQDMLCYAIAVDNTGHAFGEPSIMPFTTLPAGRPEDCSFDITYSNLGATSLTVIVKPSDPSTRYWMGIWPVFDWPEDDSMMTALVKQNIDMTVEDTGYPLEYVVRAVTYSDTIYEEESGLESSKSYYIYVYAMDEEGNAAGPVFKESFVTALEDHSEASIDIKCIYFDGDKMAQMYPDKFSKAAGGVVLHTEITPNEYAKNYSWAVAAGDLTNPVNYPDDATYSALQQGGFINQPSKDLVIRWGQCTVLGYASDEWGVEGKLRRMLIDVNEEGATDPKVYVTLTTSNAPEAVQPIKVKKNRYADPNARVWKRFSNVYTTTPKSFREIDF